VLRDQPNRTAPCRDRVQRPDQRHADHRPDQVAGTPGPAGGFQSGDQVADLGGVEKPGEALGDVCWPWPLEVLLLGPDPGRLAPRRGPLFPM
jgi:hypothetical protein